MPSPTISFRLKPYQIARGLQIIKAINPDYQPTSLSDIIKTVYFDYVAKMSLNRSDDVDPAYWGEIQKLMSTKIIPSTTFMDLINQQGSIPITETKKPVHIPTFEEPSSAPTDSKIKTVTNFAPPTDWLTD